MSERQDTDAVLKEFGQRRTILESLCLKTKELIEQSLEDAGVKYQSVQARVKTDRKLRTKYDDPTKGYKKLDDITDQAGLRIITYYEEEVDQVAEVIRREFATLPEKSVDKRKTEPDRFGYYALHFVCLYLKQRTDIIEYRKFAGLFFEIQVTPILQHAWSEIEHEWYDLKAAFPENIKRRFFRLSAVLEVVGSEFSEIRKLRDNYTKAVELQVQARVDVPLDAISYRSLLAEGWVRETDDEIAAAFGKTAGDPAPESVASFVLNALKLEGLATVDQVRTTFNKNRKAITAFSIEFLRQAGVGSVNLQRGTSLSYFSLFLLARRNEDEFFKVLTSLKVTSRLKLDLVRELARQALEKQ